MAQRMATQNTSSDCDNAINAQSTSPPPPPLLNRRSLRSLSIATIFLLSVVVFSSISLVRSFPVRPVSPGKNTLVKQKQFSSLGSTIKQQKQPLHTTIRASSNDDCIDNDVITPSAHASSDEKKETAAAAAESTITTLGGTDDGYDGLGEYDPSENLPQTERAVPNVGDPQLRVKEKDWSVTNILKELAAIQQQGPQKYCILGTRHCSYMHQQIIELLYVPFLYFFTRQSGYVGR